MIKECTKCKITKDIDLFPKESRIKSGHSARCKLCCNAYNKLIRVKNNYKVKEIIYYKNNKSKIDDAKRKYRKNNVEKCAVASHLSYTKNKPRYKLNSTKIKCDKNGRAFLISDEHFLTLCTEHCYYCGLLGDNGVDRLDSNVGYTYDNVVSCCPQCNTMKLDYSMDEFINKCKLIVMKAGVK